MLQGTGALAIAFALGFWMDWKMAAVCAANYLLQVIAQIRLKELIAKCEERHAAYSENAYRVNLLASLKNSAL